MWVVETQEIDLKIINEIFCSYVALMLIGCTNEKTSTSKEKFGHWKYKGSSTFEQRFQCVQQFMPRQNINCE